MIPRRAAELAARQEVIDLVNRRPDLWPLLNRLTLTSQHEWLHGGANWCEALRQLRRAATIPQRLALRLVA